MPVSLTFNADPANGYDIVERLFLDAGRRGAFSSIVIDGPGGLLANMDMATDALGRSAETIILTYWPGIIDPRIAARQTGFLHSASMGRLSLRFILEDGRDARRHVTAIRELGVHIEALKATWNTLETSRTGRSTTFPVLRLGGATGASLRLAARHADVFELPAGNPALLTSVIDRLDTARLQIGRRDRIALALPIRLARSSDCHEGELLPSGGELVYRGIWTKLGSALEPYLSLGIDEIMIGGPVLPAEIDRFERDAAPALLARALLRPQYVSERAGQRRSGRVSGSTMRPFRNH